MSIFFTLLTKSPSLFFPQSLVGRLTVSIAWLLFICGIAVLLWRARADINSWDLRTWGIFIVLACLVPVTSLFIGLHLPARGFLPPPGIPVEEYGPSLMVFAAIPWMLAAGLLGPTWGAVLAGFSGVLLA